MNKISISTIILLGLCFHSISQPITTTVKSYFANPDKYTINYNGFVTTANSNGMITITPPVQINSDWNAPSGKAQILNKPVIPSPDGNNFIYGASYTGSTLTLQRTGLTDINVVLNSGFIKTAIFSAPNAFNTTVGYNGTELQLALNAIGTTNEYIKGNGSLGNISALLPTPTPTIPITADGTYTITLGATNTTVRVTGSLTTVKFVMAPGTYDGQNLSFKFGSTATNELNTTVVISLDFEGASGVLLYGNEAATAIAGDAITYKWDATINEWFRFL